MALFYKNISQYRSTLYETARGLLRSRNHQTQLAQQLSSQVRELTQDVQQLANKLRRTKEQLEQTKVLLQQHL